MAVARGRQQRFGVDFGQKSGGLGQPWRFVIWGTGEPGANIRLYQDGRRLDTKIAGADDGRTEIIQCSAPSETQLSLIEAQTETGGVRFIAQKTVPLSVVIDPQKASESSLVVTGVNGKYVLWGSITGQNGLARPGIIVRVTYSGQTTAIPWAQTITGPNGNIGEEISGTVNGLVLPAFLEIERKIQIEAVGTPLAIKEHVLSGPPAGYNIPPTPSWIFEYPGWWMGIAALIDGFRTKLQRRRR